MLFPTLTFGLFFLVVFAAVWTAWSNDWRKLLLLVASWVFYGAWDWRFVPLRQYPERSAVAGPRKSWKKQRTTGKGKERTDLCR